MTGSTPVGYEEWLAANDTFLANYMAWLRTRLSDLSRVDQDATTDSVGRTPPISLNDRSNEARDADQIQRFFRRRRALLMGPPTTNEAPETPAVSIPRRDPAQPTPSEVPAPDQSSPLGTLCRTLGLSDFERNVLLLCVAMELDTRIADLCGQAQHDARRPFPSFGLALALFNDAAWAAMSPERPLRYWQLVDIALEPGEPLVVGRLHADERIVNYIKGLDHVDNRLRPLLHELPPVDADLPSSQLHMAGAISRAITQASGTSMQLVVQLLGRDQASIELVAAHAASGLGLRIFKITADALPSILSDADAATRLWRRETLLAPVCLFLDAFDLDPEDPAAVVVRRWLERGGGLVFFRVRDRWPGAEAGSVVFEVTKPTRAEQRQTWRTALGTGDLPERLASEFDFDLATIRLVLAGTAPGAGEDVASQLWTAARNHARPALDHLAQLVEAKATWADLKLPDEEENLLRQIAGQVSARGVVYADYGFGDRMNRGLGISVLFVGESGTGKTMAAEVLANELGLLLYRIDLSAVVSKYIGETEKNLRRLFDAAEDGGALLFFDEADALFGKRSEVRDSHDRYANIEINYLLQRMESFRGLAVLASNRRDNLDQAFTRRLRFVVNFPFPALAERRAIWEWVFPSATPVTGLDTERLARLNLTGGSIHNIALSAAFLAARSNGTVTMPLILSAARTEFRKLEKPRSEADFRWQENGAEVHGH